jgi:signal peptidase I
MKLRVLRAYEPGNMRSGLVGVSFPEDETEIPEDANLLVSIHEPGLTTTSFHLEGAGKSLEVVPYGKILTPLTHDESQPERSKKRRVISAIAYTLVVVLFAAVALLGLTGILSMRVVLTNSMEPNIMPGDVIVTVSDNFRSPQVGDVVVYTAKNFDGKPIAPFAHRIIGGDAETGWVVKGDNNAEADVQHPTSVDIESVTVGVIPQIGKFLNVQFLLLFALLIFGIWLIVDGVRTKR